MIKWPGYKQTLMAVILVMMGCSPTQAPADTLASQPTVTLPAMPTATLEQTVDPTPATTEPEIPTSPAALVETSPTETPESEAEPKANLPPQISLGYTHQRPDGNRLVAGRGSLPEAQVVDIPLAGEPRWIVAAPLESGSLWAVVLADHRVQAFRAKGNAVTETSITPEQLLPGTPPHLKIEDGNPTLLTAPIDAPSPETHPVMLNQTGRLAFVHAGGAVMIWNGTGVETLEVNALPDARLLVDESERLLLLTGATERYDHGVLGDGLEASSISLIETQPVLRTSLTIPIPAPSVVEGIAPIWADLTGDGEREIIVTQSNVNQGAQVVIYNEAGEQIATGPAIGAGYRWRHQLVVAPFGPRGELELVDVLTPHIGGVVEFYQLEGDSLRIVAQVRGYTSHVIGTRNLDMAVAGDFDGDDRLELLLPNQARTELGGLRRTTDGAEVAWIVAVDGVVTTNLAAVTRPDGRVSVGVGRADGVLRLWLP